ncbi:unnamed protein product, partial [Darwinula stevensoni]
MDPTEVIKMMSPGDSVVIHAELDSTARVNFPFAKANDKFEFQFALKSVMTQEEYQANLKASSEKSKIQDEKTLLAYFAKNNIKAKKTASGLYYAISKNGVGATPEAGKEVSVNYTGKQMVIAGWDEGLALLNKGAKAVLYIPSYLAYGAQSPSPKIPNSILKLGAPELPWMKKGAGWWFDQDVVVVKQKKQADAFKEKAQKAKAQMMADSTAIAKYVKANNISGTKKHPTGLVYKMIKTGTGDTARAGQKVTVNYTGKTIEGKKFDSNVDSAFNHVQPFSFTLGQGQVIPGWDIGVSLLQKGSKATLFIPSPMAYGERSPSPEIPKNGILIFDVEVTNIEAGEAPQEHGPGDGHNH